MRLLLVLFALLFAPASVSAHGGGLNQCGCHFNRKTDECHCHRQSANCGCECDAPSCKEKPEPKKPDRKLRRTR